MKPGEMIGELAREKNINLRQLAIKANIPYNTLYAMVKRKSERIDPGTLQRIADALGVHILDLTGVGKELDKYTIEIEIPPDATQEDIKRITAAFDGKTCRDLYDELSDEDKKEFWKIGQDYKAEVEQVARDYDSLDQWGKQAVRAVISVEQERMRGTEGKDTPEQGPPPESP